MFFGMGLEGLVFGICALCVFANDASVGAGVDATIKPKGKRDDPIPQRDSAGVLPFYLLDAYENPDARPGELPLDWAGAWSRVGVRSVGLGKPLVKAGPAALGHGLVGKPGHVPRVRVLVFLSLTCLSRPPAWCGGAPPPTRGRQVGQDISFWNRCLAPPMCPTPHSHSPLPRRGGAVWQDRGGGRPLAELRRGGESAVLGIADTRTLQPQLVTPVLLRLLLWRVPA